MLVYFKGIMIKVGIHFSKELVEWPFEFALL